MYGWMLSLVLLVLVALLVFWERRDECTVLQTIRHGDYDIQIVDDLCKEGLPHTTGPNTVRMTRADWEGPRRDDILRHEQIHLQQKRVSGPAWLAFYKSQWDYKCVSTVPDGVPADFVARLRPNPDTAANPWAIWRDRWLFFPIFTEDGSLRNAEVIVWDLEQHRQVSIPDEWKAEFCAGGACPHQYEHPHEISAELVASIERPSSNAAKKLFNWLK
jgi:hypothetical protein